MQFGDAGMVASQTGIKNDQARQGPTDTRTQQKHEVSREYPVSGRQCYFPGKEARSGWPDQGKDEGHHGQSAETQACPATEDEPQEEHDTIEKVYAHHSRIYANAG
jgi:hypothetical protein